MLRTRTTQRVAGLHIEFAQLMEDLIGDLTSVPQPIEINLYGDNEDLLRETAEKVADAVGKISGVVDVGSGLVVAGDALEVKIDPLKASLQGIDPAAITAQLNDLWSGAIDASVQRGPKTLSVRVNLGETERKREQQLAETTLGRRMAIFSLSAKWPRLQFCAASRRSRARICAV